MKAGDVFRLVKAADKHAKVVISDPERFPEKVLIVGMTSWDPHEDHSCVLLKDEHSTCVIPRTCITYARGNAKASNADLDAMVRANLITVFEPVSPNLLARIRAGAMLSRRTPNDFKRLLIEQGLVPGLDAAARQADGTDLPEKPAQ